MRCQIDQNINKFWELVGDVINEDLRGMQYAARLRTLLAHHVGLWTWSRRPSVKAVWTARSGITQAMTCPV